MNVLYELEAGVATITLNRPERMNAMNPDTYRELSEAWERVRDDSEVRCAVITGAGERAFSAGADLKEPMDLVEDTAGFWRTQKEMLLNRGMEVWKPVIAAVNGYCLAGGMTLLMATDLRVCSQDARFGVPEILRGLLPGNGGTQRVLEQLPHAVGMELLLLGRTLDAEEALRWGLVNRVVPQSEVLPVAHEYAEKLAALPTYALQANKELALRARDMDRSTGLRMEMTMLRALANLPEARELKAAFAAGKGRKNA